MKQRLINRWMDLCDKLSKKPMSAPRMIHQKKRIESILWIRYKYDIALTKTYFKNGD